jgi:hypothetical protein
MAVEVELTVVVNVVASDDEDDEDSVDCNNMLLKMLIIRSGCKPTRHEFCSSFSVLTFTYVYMKQ